MGFSIRRSRVTGMDMHALLHLELVACSERKTHEFAVVRLELSQA